VCHKGFQKGSHVIGVQEGRYGRHFEISNLHMRGQRCPPKNLVKSAMLGKKGHSLEASKRIWSRLINYSHFSGVYTALFLFQHAASEVAGIVHYYFAIFSV